MYTRFPVSGCCLTRRSFLAWSSAAGAGLGLPAAHAAGTWPARPIQLTVVSPAGSGPDSVARDLAARIGVSLGQPLVLENVAGAGGIVGMDRARHASRDGHHFVFTHIGAVVISPVLQSPFPYDPVRDFDPVSLVLTAPMILVAAASLGVQSLEQLVELGRTKPGLLMYGSAGTGTPPHVFVEQFKAAKNLRMDHVPYKGSPGLVQGLMGGQVAVGMEGATAFMPLIQSGKVRALAVSGEQRMAILPDVPTFAEQGVPDIGVSWIAVMAPRGTLPEAVAAMSREITRALALPELRASWAALGRTVQGGAPEILAERIRIELPRWRQVIAQAGIKAE